MKHVLAVAVGLILLNLSAGADLPGARIVDAVTVGDEQNERDHGLKSENSTTRQVGERTYRFAETNGWFTWTLKVLPDEPQELSMEFGGGGRQRTSNNVEILVGETRLAKLLLTGGARQEFYPLSKELLTGKSAITVKVQPVGDSRVGGVGGMAVMTIAPPSIASMSKASSPRTNYQFIVNAINDQREPKSSGDRLKRHFDWWPVKGTNQWAQYDFAHPARVSAVEVYWFDDTGIGECRLPKSWQLFYRQNGEWKPVGNPSGYGCEGNRYNKTTFDPVETDGLRLDAVLPERFSSGLLQWRVE